jgi:hypothetical protein
MYVNCPNIGLVGETMNPLKLDSFETDIVLGNRTSSYYLIGTSPDLIFQADQTILFVALPSNITVGETSTNLMGGYEYNLPALEIPDGTTEMEVVFNNVPIRTIMVQSMEGDDGTDGSSSGETTSATTTIRFLPNLVAMTLIATAILMMVV